MNKAELISSVAEKTEMTKKATTAVLDNVLNVITDTLVAGDSVKLAGFGTFEIVERAERTGRNPSTGEKMTIAATKAPKFKASQNLKDAVK